MTVEQIALAEVAAELTEFWSQRVVGEANGSLFKVAKGLGSTTWHSHPDEEETFLILRGELVVQFRDGDVLVREGELLVIPRGVEHCPRADREVHFLAVGVSVTSTLEGGKPAWSFTSKDESTAAKGHGAAD